MPHLPVVPYRRNSMSTGGKGWPEERSVLFKALCGHPIQVSQERDYLRLYHIFGRMPEAKEHTLIRKRMAPQSWRIFAITKSEFAVLGRL